MKYSLSLVLVVSFGLLISSCKDDPVDPGCTTEPTPMLKISVQPKFGANDLELDSSYTTAEGYLVKFTDIKFYMHDIRNGSNQLINAALFDYGARGTLLTETAGDKNNFAALQGNLGVDASENHDDPSAFSVDSWLNISNSNDMHWNWNPGYIFVKVEAKADTIPDATADLNHNIVFHCGLDTNLQTLNYTGLNWVNIGNDTHELKFELDMATFLQGSSQSIDLKTEFSSHAAPGQEALTLKVMENFKEALSPL